MTAVHLCQYTILVAGTVVILLALLVPGVSRNVERVVGWVAGVCFLAIAAAGAGLAVAIW